MLTGQQLSLDLWDPFLKTGVMLAFIDSNASIYKQENAFIFVVLKEITSIISEGISILL